MEVRADETDLAEFLAKYPDASKRLEQRNARIKCVCKLSRPVDRQSGKSETKEGIFAADHGFQKLTLTFLAPQGEKPERVETIDCVGVKTAFRLSRNLDSVDRKYEVEGVGSNVRESAAFGHRFGRYLTAPYSVYGMPFSVIMKGAGFRVISAEKVDSNGRRLLRLKYNAGDPRTPYLASLLFDPAAGWIIRSGEMQMESLPGHPTSRFEIEYGADHEGIPFQSRVVFHDIDGIDKKCDFSHISSEPTPVNEFSMSSYGLPDLTAFPIASTRGNWLYWLIGIAIMAFVLSVIAKKVADRLARRAV